jgi:hypothetical protein
LFHQRIDDARAFKTPTIKFNGKWELKEFDIISETRDLQQKGLIRIENTDSDDDDFSSPIPLTGASITISGMNFCGLLSLDEIETELLQKLNEVTEINT